MPKTINGSYIDKSIVPACCKINLDKVKCNYHTCSVTVCYFRDLKK